MQVQFSKFIKVSTIKYIVKLILLQSVQNLKLLSILRHLPFSIGSLLFVVRNFTEAFLKFLCNVSQVVFKTKLVLKILVDIVTPYYIIGTKIFHETTDSVQCIHYSLVKIMILRMNIILYSYALHTGTYVRNL